MSWERDPVAINLRGGLLRNLIGIGVAIALGLGWWAFDSFRAKSGAPDVGECVTVSGTATDAEVDDAECGDDDVLYKVTADDGDCDVNEVNYTVTVNGSDAVDLCLFWEVEKGDCIKSGTDKDEKVDCKDYIGDQNVGKVASVSDDAAGKCKKQEFAFANEKRDTLVCIAANV